MKLNSTSKHGYGDTITALTFDTADSSAITSMMVTYGNGSLNVHMVYNSNTSIKYVYTFVNGVETLLELIKETSAGKFANYVRNNADAVAKHWPDGTVEHLPARKTLAGASA